MSVLKIHAIDIAGGGGGGYNREYIIIRIHNIINLFMYMTRHVQAVVKTRTHEPPKLPRKFVLILRRTCLPHGMNMLNYNIIPPRNSNIIIIYTDKLHIKHSRSLCGTNVSINEFFCIFKNRDSVTHKLYANSYYSSFVKLQLQISLLYLSTCLIVFIIHSR